MGWGGEVSKHSLGQVCEGFFLKGASLETLRLTGGTIKQRASTCADFM